MMWLSTGIKQLCDKRKREFDTVNIMILSHIHSCSILPQELLFFWGGGVILLLFAKMITKAIVYTNGHKYILICRQAHVVDVSVQLCSVNSLRQQKINDHVSRYCGIVTVWKHQ